MKKKYRYLLLFILMLSAVMIGVVMVVRKTEKNSDKIIEYTEELLGYEIGEYISSVDGEIEKSLIGDDYMYVELRIQESKQNRFSSLLEERYGESILLEGYKIPGYEGHRLASKLKEKEIKRIYAVFREGKRAKTRAIDIYYSVDKNNDAYLYLFG